MSISRVENLDECKVYSGDHERGEKVTRPMNLHKLLPSQANMKKWVRYNVSILEFHTESGDSLT
jgi:hypothetical protein